MSDSVLTSQVVREVVETAGSAAPGAGLLRIPAPTATSVEVRFAPLWARDRYDPRSWRREPLKPSFEQQGFFEIDLDQLRLDDGEYEYEFVLDEQHDKPVADPFAEEITRFGGYRGVFRIVERKRWRPPFSWGDELCDGRRLPENHELVIYEMPLRWMASPSEEIRQVGLGTFERVVFERLEQLADLGVNAIELLPVQDSPDTLNWGYGSRFFFAPDIDMGPPLDLKFLVKRCHQKGMRVMLDVVMNHARECPLEQLAADWYFLRSPQEEPGRGDSWGGHMFRYRRPAYDNFFPAREFHYQAAEFWVREYRIDGFRIDEFQGIDHWEFVQTFRDRATAAHQRLFPGRPFLVVGEDSGRRAAITHDRPENPGGRRVVDSMWNFAFRDEARRLLRNDIRTQWGEPSRRARIEALVSGRQTWDDWDNTMKDGFADLAQAVNYLTSHDVERSGEERLMNFLFGAMLRERGLGDGSVGNVRWWVDHLGDASPPIRAAHAQATDRVRSAFALLMTSVGIPMFLAGEEFADVHDLEHGDWRLKMSDPIDWRRRELPEHRELLARVRELVRLRTSHPALLRKEVQFFYFHPAIDADGGERVFAFARTAGEPLGSAGQVAVVANAGPHDFPHFALPWPWAGSADFQEHAAPCAGAALPQALAPQVDERTGLMHLALAPFQIRVFATWRNSRLA